MLKHLSIRNYTLIEKLEIDFPSGFSVITGETGAGKSIILGAIGLLLGQRADSKQIKTGEQKCTVEAHFDLSRYDMETFFRDNDIDYDREDCILRRELTAAGKSRAFINDTPVQLSIIRELGEQLIDIHSQHQNLLLNKENFQLSVVDIIANDSKQLQEYRKLFDDYHKALRKYNLLKDEIEKNRQNEDFLRFQLNELEEANLQENEQDDLEQKIQMMEHAEEIKTSLYETDNILSGDNSCVEKLRLCYKQLQAIENVYAKASELAGRIESCQIELKDIAQEVSNASEQIDFDPIILDQHKQRLDLIYHLQNKHKVDTIGELLDIYHNLKHQIDNINCGDETLENKKKECEALFEKCTSKAMSISKLRHGVSTKIEQQIIKQLTNLGMPHVRFEIHFDMKEISSDGCDKVAFMFSANSNTTLQHVSQVASGGEIARVMLALKAMISGTVKLPTIIFDEIDTGVSGKIAEQMANIMGKMGQEERQVISITHLPQIAAKGKVHYKVYKEETAEGTVSHMVMLNKEERVDEIAQMLSGSKITAAAIDNAKQLLE